MRPAEFARREGDRVRCGLCPHGCQLGEEQFGLCNVRTVRDGTLMTLVYGMVTARHADPIEKKPLFHFLPGSRSLSIATPGCNFGCAFCQNWHLSQPSGRSLARLQSEEVPPGDVVDAAVREGCASLAFTYSEPTIFYEYVRDCAKEAAARSIACVLVTNGFIEREPLLGLRGLIHGANVDLKAFRDSTYRRVLGGGLSPVLDSMIRMKREMGMWVEVTTLVIPSVNDSEAELRDIARFIQGELGRETPWHVSRFHPDFRLCSLDSTPTGTLERAREIGLEEGLCHVYTGNVPGDPGETTYCPGCQRRLIRRIGFQVRRNDVVEGRCPGCHVEIAGVWSFP